MRAFLVVELPLISTDLANLEFTADEMRRMGYATIERLVDHILSLETQPARGDVAAADLCRRLREPAPEQGVAYEPLLDQLLAEWVPRSFTAPGPGYLAYIPGGGLYPAGLADLIADVVNRYTGVWLAAPALVQLESNTLDWLRDWMEFPAQTRGLFTTGGSMAHFNAVLCAREQHLGSEIRPGVLYGSTQMHHSMIKSARLAGIMPDRIRAVQVDEQFRMDVEALADAIAADRRVGLRPFCVTSSAGTTNTGAVDPLHAIADLCAREGLWHHVDGAYGAFFYMCPELRDLMPGLSRADSLTLDPHKGLFLPYGTGALLVRDGHRGTGSSSDQTTRGSQAGVSRVSGGAANHPRLRNHAHDPEGTGEVGERVGYSATDSLHQQAVRSGGMRRSRGNSTSRALVAS